MLTEKPFIHLFKTPLGYYFFDVNTNCIIRVKEKVYNILFKRQEGTLKNSEIDIETKDIIKGLIDKKFLSSNKPKEIEHPQTRYLDYQLNNKMKKITLQLTQNCNFRCSYCIYSQTENGKQRHHSNKRMSFETAKKAIDFLIAHSRDEGRVNVGFYGGEPLLEFDLLKKCVLYAEKVGEGKEIDFSITTNGTLFNSEIIEFFMKHDVITLVSFDGPKEIHDRHRRFASGEGSFEKISENLRFIKENYPQYFDKLSFNVVVNPQDDYNCVNRFFVDYEYFKESNVRSSLIDDLYLDEKNKITENYIVSFNYEIFKMFLNYLGKVDKKYISPIALQELDSLKKFEEELDRREKLLEKTAPGGPCIPGQLRLFINTDGYFYPCERVSEVSPVMRIGHIDSGFDINKAQSLLNVGKLTQEQCKNCWAITHCTLCGKHADNNHELSGELKSRYCNGVRQALDNKLKKYVEITEIKKRYEDVLC